MEQPDMKYEYVCKVHGVVDDIIICINKVAEDFFLCSKCCMYRVCEEREVKEEKCNKKYEEAEIQEGSPLDLILKNVINSDLIKSNNENLISDIDDRLVKVEKTMSYVIHDIDHKIDPRLKNVELDVEEFVERFDEIDVKNEVFDDRLDNHRNMILDLSKNINKKLDDIFDCLNDIEESKSDNEECDEREHKLNGDDSIRSDVDLLISVVNLLRKKIESLEEYKTTHLKDHMLGNYSRLLRDLISDND